MCGSMLSGASLEALARTQPARDCARTNGCIPLSIDKADGHVTAGLVCARKWCWMIEVRGSVGRKRLSAVSMEMGSVRMDRSRMVAQVGQPRCDRPNTVAGCSLTSS